MTITPTVETDEDGFTTIDYSRGLVSAVITHDPDETFWRFEAEVSDISTSTREAHIAAAHIIIAAATDLLALNNVKGYRT